MQELHQYIQHLSILNVVSNGIPYPATANAEHVKVQSYNYKFNYRAGTNTQNPQEVYNDALGIFANGVIFKTSPSNVQLPGFLSSAPRDFKFNRVQLQEFYDTEPAGAIINDGVYSYTSSKFLSSSWQGSALPASSEYYRLSNFNNDYLRHTDGHSKILGFAFDGYPIYGPFGYLFPVDAESGIKQVISGYVAHANDSHRPVGWKYDNIINTNQGEYTLVEGTFVEDYIFSNNASKLDQFNGQFCVTPDFPNGTYAYFLTFAEDNLNVPAYPYIIGHSTKQRRTFFQETAEIQADPTSMWSVTSGTRHAVLIERQLVNVALPVITAAGMEIEIISGSLPGGARLEGTNITGRLFEVAYDTSYVVVFRARYDDLFEDRTLEFVVTGSDKPSWITDKGLLEVGPNDNLYILDNAPIDFQLIATDTDLPAGDVLTYYIAENDGVLPPGIILTDSGKIQGIVEPLLSLDNQYRDGGYDSSLYGELPMDYSTLSASGFASYYYDNQTYDYSEKTNNVKKLNRYYPFAVTVSDGVSFVRREFRIYVVGDDYLLADNTVMHASTGVFKADATNVRTPIWITPTDLGYKRANNYATIYLDVIDSDNLEGELSYNIETVNDDSSVSELPDGLTVDNTTGEITGFIPYQPAITTDYKFTVRATRVTSGINIVEIFANFYEDTMLGKYAFKIFKVDLSGDIDGVDDLFDLIGRSILLNSRQYNVTRVDNRNEEYDIIYVDESLSPDISLLLSRSAPIGQDYAFVKTLSELQKEKYNNRVLKFSETESYTITSIVPYIEYEILQAMPNSTPIYPSGVPQLMQANENYFIGDYAEYTIKSGGDGFIYKCIVPHSVAQQLDNSNNIIFDADGNIQIDFDNNSWIQVAETLNELSINELVTAAQQSLEVAYNGRAFIDVVDIGHWIIRVRSTALSRNVANIKAFFVNTNDSISVKLINNTEDFITFDKILTTQLNQGRNIGVALFRNDFFSKLLIINDNEDNVPSSTKTFSLRVIGEIDSNISWITPANLGTINANFISNYKIEAETTVPDSKMIYTIKHGKLPFGMQLRFDGEITGIPNQFENNTSAGLTTFDNGTISWDGKFTGDTTIDRKYKFTIEARDRFGFTAIEREFTLTVEDADPTLYTDIYMRPMLEESTRALYRNFVSTPAIFEPDKIYRLGDDAFGVQHNLDMLVYAGIEAKSVGEFVAGAAKNHKRNQYAFGEFKTAFAQELGSDTPVYEVVYLEVIDHAHSDKGKTASKFKINNKTKITVDSLQYAAKDDSTGTGNGEDVLGIYGRGGFIRFIITELDQLIIETRQGDVALNVNNADFEIELFDTSSVNIELERGPSEPYRIRPSSTNTIKADSNAINVSQSTDNVRYRSSIEHMRDNISQIGKRERNYLPLWMRTSQNGLQELDYITAIPVCYCKPGQSAKILNNIQQSGFDQHVINYDIDRYIVKRTEGNQEEQFILFANYQFNA